MLAFLLFIIAVIACAQLNCYIERRRDMNRNDIEIIQNLEARRGIA